MNNNYKADNKGILIIYNIYTAGGLKGFSNWQADIDQILSQSIFSQEDLNCKLAICDCRGSRESDPQFCKWLNYLKSRNVTYNAIRQILPMALSVNCAAKKMVELNGTYEYYVYWGSGLRISQDNQLLTIYKLLLSDSSICRASLLATNDNKPPEGHSLWKTNKRQPEMLVLQPGQVINDHCSIYSNEYFESFDRCVRPDIFAGNGSENAFPYMAASIGRRCVVLPTDISPQLSHTKRNDGENSPGLCTRRESWYIKSIKGNEILYLRDPNEMKEKGARLRAANIMTADSGRYKDMIAMIGMTIKDQLSNSISETYGKDGMELAPEEREKLHQTMKKEFFIQNFDYNDIKLETNEQ